MTKIIQTIIIVGILLFSTGCAINKVDQLVDCKKDVACANKLITQCNQGVFITGDANVEVKFIIQGKQKNNCVVKWNFLDASTIFGNSDMYCLLPPTITDVKEISNYLFRTKYQGCKGELKDKITKPVKEVFPELNKEQVTCVDDECINKMVASCEKGSFIIKITESAHLKFSIQRKLAVGCSVEAQFVKNSNSNLVGPQMGCLLPVTVKTMVDIDNLIKNKFIVSDEHSSSNICSGELYKMIK